MRLASHGLLFPKDKKTSEWPKLSNPRVHGFDEFHFPLKWHHRIAFKRTPSTCKEIMPNLLFLSATKPIFYDQCHVHQGSFGSAPKILLKTCPWKQEEGVALSKFFPTHRAPGLYRYMLCLHLLVRCLLLRAILGLRTCNKIDLDICLLNLRYHPLNEQLAGNPTFTIGSATRNGFIHVFMSILHDNTEKGSRGYLPQIDEKNLHTPHQLLFDNNRVYKNITSAIFTAQGCSRTMDKW